VAWSFGHNRPAHAPTAISRSTSLLVGLATTSSVRRARHFPLVVATGSCTPPRWNHTPDPSRAGGPTDVALRSTTSRGSSARQPARVSVQRSAVSTTTARRAPPPHCSSSSSEWIPPAAAPPRGVGAPEPAARLEVGHRAASSSLPAIARPTISGVCGHRARSRGPATTRRRRRDLVVLGPKDRRRPTRSTSTPTRRSSSDALRERRRVTPTTRSPGERRRRCPPRTRSRAAHRQLRIGRIDVHRPTVFSVP